MLVLLRDVRAEKEGKVKTKPSLYHFILPCLRAMTSLVVAYKKSRKMRWDEVARGSSAAALLYSRLKVVLFEEFLRFGHICMAISR